MSSSARAPKPAKGALAPAGFEDLAWLCIDTGKARTTKALAVALKVSTATMTRVLSVLRKHLAAEGAELVSVRTPSGWEYRILNDEPRHRARLEAWERRGFIGFIRGRAPRWSKQEDLDLYGQV